MFMIDDSCVLGYNSKVDGIIIELRSVCSLELVESFFYVGIVLDRHSSRLQLSIISACCSYYLDVPLFCKQN
jgi:hypothetical protein